MHHPNGHPIYSQNISHQQLQSHQTTRPFQQQQLGPRFQTPQHLSSSSYHQLPRPHCNRLITPYQSSINHRSFYQPDNFDQISKPSYPPPIQNFKTSPNPQYPPQHGPLGPGFSPPIPSYRAPEPHIQNLNQPFIENYNYFPPPIQTYNQSPNQNINNPPIPNYNQPPPIQNYDQSPTPPYQSAKQNSLFQSSNPGHSPSQNASYQLQNPKSLNQSYQLPIDQFYKQQPPPFNLPRPEFNQRPPFKPQGQQKFPFSNQIPRYQQQQPNYNRFQFHSKQQYQNNNLTGPPPSFNNPSKKDKLQIACELGDCDFVGHPGAVKEHQNLHHRLGLHKKVLYSNNSDAVKNWIEERKKKWPTKNTIKIKLEVEDEKIKRGERIADNDFQRFNNKNNKFNHSNGLKRFDKKKRLRPNNADYIEPIEEPMNGHLKRFAGIVDIKKQEDKMYEISKPVSLKLLEEYAESSDDEPPEEIAIIKKSVLFDNQSLIEPEICSTSEMNVPIKHEKINSMSTIETFSNKISSVEVKIENGLKIKEECKISDSEHGHKRKNNSKKESKPIKKIAPMRTPRTEVMERKGALIEVLMGDLMRNERNTITQCICYIRNNMHRFNKIQVA